MKSMKILFAVMLTGSFLVYCGDSKKKMTVINEYKLKVPEPSGLALSIDGKKLWTVSDQNSTVYKISLNGEIESSFTVKADDLEGIAVLSDTSIAVVAERSREVILLNNNGKEFFRKKLLNDAIDNHGLEGIAFNKNNGNFFFVKEKRPKILIECDKNLNEIKRTKIDFLDDLSGLDYTPGTNDLWIISDESKTIAKCDNDGNVKENYKVKIDQIEGIAVDAVNNIIYLVSDKKEKLYVMGIK